ncbi:MAG: CHAT domain-containing tetratricopeptide repeat protein [Bacteroidota bacterium]
MMRVQKCCLLIVLSIFFFIHTEKAVSAVDDHFQADSTVQEKSVERQNLDSLFTLGKKLLRNGKFGKSRHTFEKAKEIAIVMKDDDENFSCENYIIETLWRDYKLDEAFQRTYSLLKYIPEKEANSEIIGRTWHNLGTLHLFKGSNDSSIYAFEKAIEFYLQMEEPDLTRLSGVYNNMGIIYYNMSDWENAFEFYNKCLEIDRKVYGDHHEYVTMGLTNLGSLLATQGLHKKALSYYLSAQESIKNSKSGTNATTYAGLLANIGSTYDKLDEHHKGILYSEQALDYSINAFGINHPIVGKRYYELGKYYSETQQLDSAEFYFQKAMRFKNDFEKVNDMALNVLVGDLSVVLSLKGRLKDGIKLLDDRVETINSNNHTVTNLLLRYKAYAYFCAHDFENAKNTYDFFLKKYGDSKDNPIQLIQVYKNYAETLLSLGEYEQALKSIQLSLKENMIDWNYEKLYDNPDSLIANQPFQVIYALNIKAKTLSELYEKEEDFQDLDASLKTYDLLDQFIHQLRQSFPLEDDKFQLQRSLNESYDIYTNAVDSYYKANQATGEDKYLKKCFQMSESSKSAIITDAFNSFDLNKLSNVSDSLIDLEEEQKSKIAFYISELNNIDATKDSSRYFSYRSKLLKAYNTKDSIVHQIEEGFPNYHTYKYQNSAIQVEEIQKSLSPDMTMVAYFLSDSSNYAFIIQEDRFRVHDFGKIMGLDSLIHEFRKGVQTDNQPIGNFFAANHKLYQLLFEPLRLNESHHKSLVIIPDKTLGYIPFEALLTEPVAGNQSQYHNHSYLIKKFDISYSYSAEYFINSQRNDNEKALSFVGFAPSYGSRQPNELEQLGTFRNALVPLSWNKKELQQISQYIPGEQLVGKDATETEFKNYLSKPGVIHLAMHALVDDENPMNSKLAFSQARDTLEDGFLHTFELYNMGLKANMVVLSACETGYGQLKENEGIISLASGFVSAGVPSIVMSHWNVDDKITSRLMSLFYKHLSEGKRKDQALRDAKLELMNESDPAISNPYYWAAFVVVGDVSPLSDDGIPIVFWVLGLVVLIVISWTITKRNKAAKV